MGKMRCKICGGFPEKTAFWYRTPDKYERWVGLKEIKRLWVRCSDCGFYWQLRSYPLSHLEKIYRSGYRHSDFRGETIAQAYRRISAIKYSENERRFLWFAYRTNYEKTKKILDIGSGIGVWPALLKKAEYSVTCVEENAHSINFIYENLGIGCYRNLQDTNSDFDAVSLIHVLEHIEDVDGFLGGVRKKLLKGGYLFVEVPDSSEFGVLKKNHDEFNSCHVAFYDMGSLYRVLKRNGFNPIDSGVLSYKGRGLTRLMMLCN
jgi:SAM-dependent methyltransferase